MKELTKAEQQIESQNACTRSLESKTAHLTKAMIDAYLNQHLTETGVTISSQA